MIGAEWRAAAVEAGRAMIERADRSAPPTVHHADQLDAAARDARRLVHRLNGPSRRYGSLIDGVVTAGLVGVTFAAMARCWTCPHLRGGAPQPGVANLATGHVACYRCVRTHRSPPPGTGDRCDLCWEHGHETFRPVVWSWSVITVTGDACPACAELIRRDVG